jgi:LysM repeat protein
MIRALALTAVTLAALLGVVLRPDTAAADDTYTVKDGDSLLAIAATLGIATDKQLDWVATTVTLNNLVDADSIKAGQTLKLPTPERTAALVQATPATPPAAGGSYTVKDGDTLLGIAGKLNVPAAKQLEWVEKLLALNGITSVEKLLSIGQVLKLPGEAPVTTTATNLATTSPQSTGGGTSALATTPAVLPPGVLQGSATAYAEYFNGRNMGCRGAGPFSSKDITVIAVGPAMYDAFPCGTPIEVCGAKGCITGVRKDSCPGCTAYHVDLSRAGFTAVCGVNVCSVRIKKLAVANP